MKQIIENKINQFVNYINDYNIQSLVIGLSGGIDSTLMAVLANKVCSIVNIPLIGVSLPTLTNNSTETEIAHTVGELFCTEFKEVSIHSAYNELSEFVNEIGNSSKVPIPEGNIKARLRMIILYHLAWHNKGIVLDTDNQTEHQLGFFTIHGDQGDFGLLNDLYKTEVFELGKWIIDNWQLTSRQKEAIQLSLNLNPTDGNGCNPDLVQYGEPDFETVDKCLKDISVLGFVPKEIYDEHPTLATKWDRAWFKREGTPLYIDKEGFLCNSRNEWL